MEFKILSLDGGGLLGLFSAAVLANIEKDYNINVTDYFDLIVGTSTGGLISLALGKGIKPKDIVSFYVEQGKYIFPNNLFRSAKQFYHTKYNADNLESILKEFYGKSRLIDSKKRLVVPAFNIDNNSVYIFKTPHHDRFIRDRGNYMWQVGMATSAAPTFLPCFTGIDSIRLIDGGVWANNPMLVGIIEALSILNQKITDIRVLSIGTTTDVKHRDKKLNNGGFWQWKKDAIEVFLNAQSVGCFNMSSHLLGNENTLRLNPQVPPNRFKLDRLNEAALMSLAASNSREASPKIKSIFLNNKAEEYTPLNPEVKS